MGFLNMFSSAVIMLLLISLLILVHELGHFFAAKAVGIRVDKFGFGLPVGPTLFSKKIGETEFLLHAFLLGGYVSFPDDEEECDLPKDSPLRYSNKTVGERAIVISAGVICNVIFAYIIVFLAGLIWQHFPLNTMTVKFDEFTPTAVESIKKSGIQKGDTYYSINGLKVDYPVTISKFYNLSKEFDGLVSNEIVNTKFEELKKLNKNLVEKEIIPAGTIVKLPAFTDEKPVTLTSDNILGLEKLVSNEESLSDFQKDLRDKINYQTTYKLETEATLDDIARAISDTKKPLTLVIERNGEQITLPTIYSDKEGKVGTKQAYVENYIKVNGFVSLIKETNNYINRNMGMMVYSLGKLFTGKVPVSDMNGIIAITKIGTEIIAYKGLFQGLLLAALISLNLALINILPIPALDGGHLFFLIIEKVTGKPVSKKFVETVSNFFFYLLIVLMCVIIYNDIHAWIIGKI